MGWSPEEYSWSSYNFYIGKKKQPEWLYRDFILGYFDVKIAAAQKEYKRFVSLLVNQEYDNPLKDVVSSVMLGSPDFIGFIRDKFLSDRELDKELPSLRQLSPRISMGAISDEVEAVFGKETAFARDLKMYLCGRHSGEKLKSIGSRFNIGESAVSHACKRVKDKIEGHRKLKKKIDKMEEKLILSRFKS